MVKENRAIYGGLSWDYSRAEGIEFGQNKIKSSKT